MTSFVQVWSSKDIANISKPTGDITLSILKKLKRQALPTEEEDSEFICKATKEYTLDEAVQTFGLTYRSNFRESANYQWKIEVLPGVTIFQPSALVKFSESVIFLSRTMTSSLYQCLLENHIEIYDRSSQAAYRIAVDFLLLCECIAAMVSWLDIYWSFYSNTEASERQDINSANGQPDSVKVHCEV